MSLILLSLGNMFLLGLLADLAGRHTPLPWVTLLLFAGLMVGPVITRRVINHVKNINQHSSARGVND
jgi:xanthosine utilization system XapX-like protein